MADGKKSGGMALDRRKRSRRIALGAVCVVVALLVSALVLGPRLLDNADASEQLTTMPAPVPMRPLPLIADLPATAPLPDRAVLAELLRPLAADPVLGTLTGRISDAETGAVLWEQGEGTRLVPASATKLLTSVAALLTLTLDQTVPTTVVRGAEPGHIILVGGGDPTLSAQPRGEPSYFQDAPRLDDLVSEIRRDGVAVTRVFVDVSAYRGPLLADGWDPVDIAAGFIAPMEPVMLDGGRLQPLEQESPRSETPALAAGQLLAERLGLDPATVELKATQPGAEVLASVESAPLRLWLEEMMGDSDNVLAEAVGRQIALAVGQPASFEGATSAVLQTLRGAGFDVSGATLADTGGLSVDNRATAALLDDLVLAAAGPEGAADSAQLRPLLDYLPVAGGTGTLAGRFNEGERRGAGWVRAKTGTLDGVSALAGYVTSADGRVLTFALLSADSLAGEARPKLDEIAAAVQSCGCS